MKTCAKCNFENGDDSKFCEECGSQEFVSKGKKSGESETSGEVKIGDNSAVSTGEIVSGGKNNTTNNSSTDNSSTTNIGTSAEDMASILKVVMQENSNIIKQVLDHQQSQATAESTARTSTPEAEPAKPAEAPKAEVKPKRSAAQLCSPKGAVRPKEDNDEYELVAQNLINSCIEVLNRLAAVGSPDKAFYLKRYHFILWIALTIFIFFMAAATAISILWIVLLASLGMVAFTSFKRFKGVGVDPKREAVDKCMEDYASIRATIVSTFGGDGSEFLEACERDLGAFISKFKSEEQKAEKSAKVTTAVICGVLFVVGYLVVQIVVS